MKKRILPLALLIVLSVARLPAQAQQRVITLSLPDYLQQFFTPEVFASFETEHGVSVELVDAGYAYFANPAAEGLDTHLSEVADYVDSADVLFVTSESFTVEATRAGYFLDLAPLAATDTILDVADFYPAAWQTFQWDNGIWAMPAAIDLISLQYIPQLFDEAGLAYPTVSWTANDFIHAARTLGQHYDDRPGLMTIIPTAQAFLWYAIGGGAWYDTTTLPEFPAFNNPALTDAFTALAGLYQDGSVYFPTIITPGVMPLAVDGVSWLQNFSDDFLTTYGLPLPGDVVGMTAQGYAVSGGTAQPELAYALAKYLTTAPEAVYYLNGYAPARQSLAGAGGDIQTPMAFVGYPPENKAFLDAALMRAVPASVVRYSHYLDWAFRDMLDNGTDPTVALQQAESMALENLQAAAARRGETAVDVAQPAPIELAPGEIALTFIVPNITGAGPDAAAWQPVIDAFVAEDPDVGHVEFDKRTTVDLADFAAEGDCFMLSYNSVPSLALSQILNLDPFLDADPNFDRTDVMGGALGRVTRDNQVWAYPLAIQPEVLRYDAEQFSAAGLPMPTDDWSIEQFVDALTMLKGEPESDPPFAISVIGQQNHILLLIAAYGGLPIDYRTSPPTVNFTEPAVIEASRQVLDLALGGYIEYSSLARSGGGGGSAPVDERHEAVLSDTLNVFRARTFAESPYAPVAYPRGSQYTPVSYRLTTGYISAQTAYPEACYRWMSYFAQHPELFESMPARRSMLDSPTLAAVHGPAQVEAYRALSEVLAAPNTVVIPPGSFGRSSDYYLRQWLFRAFDRYVLEGGDLNTELAVAQQIADAYQGCEAQISPHNPAIHLDPDAYYANQMHDCAQIADPDM